jgi:16S rRNA (guanine527-N7)-methyltransferase
MTTTLIKHARTLGLTLTDEQVDRFEQYYTLLAAAAQRLNLTRVLDYEGVQRRHFLESLALLVSLYEFGVLHVGRPARVLDLGTGAGLPGLPMHIVHPELRLTLLEANKKKVSFLRSLVNELGLSDVTILAVRAEEAAHDPSQRESYDLVVARAVAPLAALVELALPFLHLGGFLAAPKGSRAVEEMSQALRALRLCGGRIIHTVPLKVVGGEHPQTVILVKKTSRTPAIYPRRPGIPQKNPL